MDESTTNIITTVSIVGGIFGLAGALYGYMYYKLTPEQRAQYLRNIKKSSRRGTRKNSRK